jgi:hypothetical protein
MKRNGRAIVFIAAVVCAAAGAFAQNKPTTPPPMPASSPAPRVQPPKARTAHFPAAQQSPEQTSEKAIAVEHNVEVRMCVVEGRVKVNGWDRNEVRVFVKDGSRFAVRVSETNPESGKPVWLQITRDSVRGPRPGGASECLSGDLIELDVPRNASLNLTGRATETSIDSIKKAFIKTAGGNIFLRNITGGITATTHEGDVAVESSGGQISLESYTGNVIAYGVSPGAVGDVFRAKTNNGAISLQKLLHRQIEASTISGSLAFDGRFLSGGLYSFKTSNGSIRLSIPADSSCKVIASYGFGTFESEFALKYLYQEQSASAKSLGALIGKGEATVNLTTNTGSIGIRRQEQPAKP